MTTAPAPREATVRPVRVAHVIHGLPRGGLENGVVNIANGLPRPEFEQVICCLDQEGELAGRLRDDVPVHVLHRGRHDVRLPLRLAGLLREVRPDVVHCRNWNAWPDCVAASRLAGLGRRVSWSFHGFLDGHEFPRRRRVASRYLAGLTPHLMAVCRDSAERYARLCGISPGRFSVLYNGVDTGRFRPLADRGAARRELGLPEDAVIVLAVGSLSPVKNHEALVDAMAAVPGQAGGTPVQAYIVGSGARRDLLEARIAERGVGHRVRLMGASDAVPRLLGAADLFVHPSHLEGMSNAILEAMAAGLPVVAFRTGGNPELVVEGETGMLCPPGDTAALAGAVAALAADAALRSAMGEKARARAEEAFSLGAMMDRYADYYRRLAA